MLLSTVFLNSLASRIVVNRISVHLYPALRFFNPNIYETNNLKSICLGVIGSILNECSVIIKQYFE